MGATKQLRTVDTLAGPIAYMLWRKGVKNLTLRVGPSGEVTLSVPNVCADRRADDMIRGRCHWIATAIARQRQRVRSPGSALSAEECRRQLQQALERTYPMVAVLGVAKPVLKIRTLKSQWGNCHWKQGYITLNTALAACPERLQDYVALHELVHFLHPNHGAGFYAQLDLLMPQWRQLRKQLRDYTPCAPPCKDD